MVLKQKYPCRGIPNHDNPSFVTSPKPVSGMFWWMTTLVAVVALVTTGAVEASNIEPAQPNIIFILVDDLGYGDVGCYGQKLIRTPNMDQMAREGIRFTQVYAGSTVCAPSRCVLMTGQHTGHASMRGNLAVRGGYRGKNRIRRGNIGDDDMTVADVLGDASYRTGLIGKWHLGGFNSQAGPLDHGFQECYGERTLVQSTYMPSCYYPLRQYRNRTLVGIQANWNASEMTPKAMAELDPVAPWSFAIQGRRGRFITDVWTEEAIHFIKKPGGSPFFLYLSYHLPHSPLSVPELGQYASKPWTQDQKTYAAMVSYLDHCIGQVMQTLEDEGLDEETIVFLCSDNGPRSGPQRQLTDVVEFFDSNGPLKGYKRDLLS